MSESTDETGEVSGLDMLKEVQMLANQYAGENQGATVLSDPDGLWIAVTGTAGRVTFEVSSPGDRSIKICRSGEDVSKEQRAVRINGELWTAEATRRPLKQIINAVLREAGSDGRI